ncbi:MAG: diaminopimelate epimerase [Candidatus Epulonipiscioides saccharophilum]|nr:MAG: diaminopimelate epimerase [Epulopiscium sp. AS2M-Bin001]
MEFWKMNGIGNDYIYFNCLDTELTDPESLAIRLSNRHFGIGGDGIVLICKSDIADAKMRMFNADGSEGKMCGNAIRCVGKYLYDTGIVQKTNLLIETLSGIKGLELYVENGLVQAAEVDMNAPILEPDKIPVLLKGESIVNREIKIGQEQYNITCVSMGNPHCVVFVNDVAGLDLDKIGPLFEHNDLFPDRINTEFVQILDESTYKMRVWERGSGETLACGTGACAVAVACVLNGFANLNEKITIKLRGGDLVIRYTNETVFMTGGATKSFIGYIEV